MASDLRMALRVGLGLVAALLVCPLQAATSSTEWFARVWRADEGLPGNTVSGIAQTADGFLWVGTDGGLARFDGAKFDSFSPAILQGVPNRVIRLIFLDSRKRLWLAMDRGAVVCAEGATARVFALDEGPPDRWVSAMAEDKDGAAWIAYSRGNLVRIKDNVVEHFGATNGLPSGGRVYVTSDKAGQLWFARGRNVGIFKKGAFETVASLPQSAMCLAAAKEGGVWVCTGSRLFRCIEGHEPVAQAFLPRNHEPVTPRALLEDRTGSVWVGTATDGLFRSNRGQVENVPTSHQTISCLMEDRESNLWVGTSGGGLDQLRPRSLELISTESGVPFEAVGSVCEDDSGTTWLATLDGSLARETGTNWLNISASPSWPGGRATCVSRASGGGVWVGTADRGLYLIKGDEVSLWDRSSLGGGSIRSLLTSSNGDLWFAKNSPIRLLRLRNGSFRTFDLPQVRVIRAMAEDSRGNIWLGTSQGQLLCVSNETVVDMTERTAPRLQSIRCLLGTPDGSIWIGYAGWGLGRLKAGRFFQYTTAEGLYDSYISQLIADEYDCLWCGGNHGLFRVKLEDFDAVSEKRAARVQSIVYGQGEGLASPEVSYDNCPGAIRGFDGQLRIATHSGLLVVHTENIHDNPQPPTVLLKRVSVDSRTVASYQSYAALLPNIEPGPVADLSSPQPFTLNIPPGHHKVEFEFTAFGLTAPENIHFRHRLDGFDDDWVESPRERQASYSQLAAGKYGFRVVACNNSGVWNETGARVNFEVQPFIWQRWWFRLVGVVLFTSAVIAIARYVSFRRLHARLRALEQQAALDKERARIAKDIHDDLGGSLTQVTMLLELALRDRAAPEKFTGHLRRGLSAARQMLKSLDETVWAINPRNDTLPHLVNYIAKFAMRFLDSGGVRCRLDLPEHPPELNMPADVRHNLFLVVKEALNNIVRHGRATEAWLRVSATEQALKMSVEDNGCGFERLPDDADADGLRNMRQRMNDMGGSFEIESNPGSGTRVLFLLPWPNQQSPLSHIRAIAADKTPIIK